MKVLLVRKPGEISVEEREVPRKLPGKSLVRVLACGLCGTDYKIFSGETEAVYPVVPGHEIVGVVEESDLFEKGTLVVVDPNRACGTCGFCRKGKPNLCENLKATGVTEDGGFAEYVLVDDTQLYPVERDVPSERTVFAEPLSCVLNGVNMARGEGHERVLVMGAGSVGVIFALLLGKIFVGAEIVLVERDEKRASFVSETFDLRVGRPKGEYDLAVECSGTVEGFKTCFDHLKSGGTLLVFGVVPKGKAVEISPFSIYKKELKIMGAHLNPFTMKEAVRIVESGEIAFEKLVTERLSLDGIKSYLEEGKRPVLKGVLSNENLITVG